MPTQLLALVAEDLKKMINPTDSDVGFMGARSDILVADVDDSLNTHEEDVMNILLERYRELMREVDGEYIVQYAIAGQTTAKLTLTPASNVRLWKNWDPGRPWNSQARHLAMDPSEYSVDLVTGEITFVQPLAERDTIIAAYNHTAGAQLLSLRNIVLTFAACDWAMRLDSVDTAVKELWERARARCYANLKAMSEGGSGGLDVFDKMVLARETRITKDKAGSWAPTGAW